MFPVLRRLSLASVLLLAFGGCDSGDDSGDDPGDDPGAATLSPAYAEFNADNVSVMLDGDQVLIESNGMPDHTSSYWSSTTARTIDGPMGAQTTPAVAVDHPLWVAPTTTTYSQMAPGNIDDFRGSYSLTVAASPVKATSTTATGLGAVGIARSGAMIYNDQEGPNVSLERAVGGLDANGAHTGPQSYHYHLEPIAWSQDDSNLIGVMADGFFLYGRRDPDGTYPTGLDASGGHTGATPHNAAGEYHYHIQNEAFLNQYYILFPGDYQGTASAIR